MNVPRVRTHKTRDGANPLVMVTAYDAPTARIVDDAGVDIILVGDSVAMVVLGYDDTLAVTVGDIAHHTAAVARAKPAALIVGDMPWLSYHLTVDDTVRNAATLIRAGADCVKLEGGTKRVNMITALCDAEIPVMGHLGLTPQSVHAMGGYKVQGRDCDTALTLIRDATALEAAGCFAIVLEGVPDLVAGAVTDSVNVPTIGIGAGTSCDGQVLVFHDLVGLGERHAARFVRRYSDLRTQATDAVSAWAKDVRTGRYPDDNETYHLDEQTAVELGATLALSDTLDELVGGGHTRQAAASEPVGATGMGAASDFVVDPSWAFG
jgi:3-methyl-2-oxobutanoate hydroxymethyltransferase